MTRKQANRAILLELYNLVEKYPQLRFGQILFNCNILKYTTSAINGIEIKDPFYEESETTLDRMMQSKIISKEYN